MKQITKDTFTLNLRIMKNNKKLLFSNFLVWLVISCMPLVYAVMVSKIIENLEYGNIVVHQVLCLVFLTIGILTTVLLINGGKLDTKFRFNITQGVTKNFIVNVIKDKKAKVTGSGQVLDIISKDIKSIEDLISFEVDLVSKLIFAMVAFVILYNTNPTLTMYTLIPVIISSQLIYRLEKKIKENHKTSRTSSINYSNFVSDILKSRETIQLIGNSSDVYKKLNEVSIERSKQAISQSIFNMLVNYVTAISGLLGVALILALAITPIKNGDMSLGELSLFISLIAYINGYNELFTEVFMAFKYTENAITIVDDILSNERDSALDSLTGYNLVDYNTKTIEPQNILFKDVVINDNSDKKININVAINEFIVICGKVGCGKTHLIDAMIGYCDYDGDIEYGENIRELFVNNIVGIANQEVHFLDETVDENINFGDGEVDIDSVLKTVNLYDELKDIRLNNEKIGVDGKRLSEGQRQRLGIARAISKNRNILVLDDSTALLDYNNEKLILANIKNMDSTKIVVSNRKNVLDIADRIIVMDNESIVDIGSKNYLMNNCMIFEDIYLACE